MSNPNILKSNQSISNHVLTTERTSREESYKPQSFSKIQPLITINQGKQSPDLFTNFRSSVQIKQPDFNDKSKKKISFLQVLEEDEQQPFLRINTREETIYDPNRFEGESQKDNNKLGLHSKKYLHLSENSRSSRSRFRDEFIDQTLKKPHKDLYLFNKNAFEPQNEQSFRFGHGLQSIDKNADERFQTTFPQKSTGLFGTQKTTKSFENVQSTFTPNPSKVSVGKKLAYRQSNELIRSTTRNFFKRPSSHTATQDFLKTLSSQSQKLERKDKNKLNLSIVPFRDNELRGSSFIKRQSIQIKSPINSHKLMSQAFINSKNIIRRQGPHLSFANSLNKLLFKYNGGHANTLYNYRLKIKNQTNVRLTIKIKCTTPRSYQVRPATQTILNPLEILSVSIELKLFSHDLNQTTMKHDLSRYHSDKFKVIYWTTDHATQEEYFEGQKVLPVIIQQTEEQKARNMGVEQNLTNEKQKQATEQKQIEMYRKLIDKNKIKVDQIDKKISVLNGNEFKHKYFSKNLFWFFAFIGMALGFWMG